MFETFVRWTGAMTRWQAIAITVLAYAAVATADRLVGPGVSMIFFNSLVTCFAAWCFGLEGGTLVALANVAEIIGINGTSISIHTNQSTGAIAWNVLTRTGAQMLFVFIAGGLRQTLEAQRWLAQSDALTGALNRRAFLDQMGRTAALARRQGSSLVLVYCDLDGFKQVNDHFGHAAGDNLLRRFSESAAEALRSYDLFARIGGDEFAALLIIPRAEDGEMLACRLHERLTEVLGQTGYPVSCSMGAVLFAPGTLTSPEAAIAQADGLMYAVKQGGRNALRIARVERAKSVSAKPERTLVPA